MKENPSINIKVRSHTDSRGEANTNLKLSSERAKAAVAYIVSKGIGAGRISGVGVGEKEIINHCRDGIECSDQEHLDNERTQYIIVKS